MLKINFRHLSVSAALTLPIIGFVTGIFLSGGDVSARILIGVVYMFLTVGFLGRPPLDESGVNFLDLRVYVLPTVLILYLLFEFRSRNAAGRESGASTKG